MITKFTKTLTLAAIAGFIATAAATNAYADGQVLLPTSTETVGYSKAPVEQGSYASAAAWLARNGEAAAMLQHGGSNHNVGGKGGEGGRR